MALFRQREVIPIYDSIYLDIIVSDSSDEISKELNDDTENNHWFACCNKTYFDNEEGMICKALQVVLCTGGKDKITPRIIVHEAVHVKNMLFHQIGYKQKDDNDEAEAYLTEWIFAEISKFFEECIGKMKKDSPTLNFVDSRKVVL